MESSDSFNSSQKLKLTITLVLILVVGSISVVSMLRDRIVNVPQWQVSITGHSKVEYQPDEATVLLGVQVDKALSSAQALSEMNDKTDKIIEALKALGISEDSITTQDFSIYTHYDYIENSSEATGCDARQQLSIKLEDIKDNKELISSVINKASEAGANRIDGVNFDVSNLEDLKQQARLQAITDAKTKAGSLANAAGVQLKKVVGWWENIIQVPGLNQQYYYDGKGGGNSSVANGVQEIIIDVSLNYQVK